MSANNDKRTAYHKEELAEARRAVNKERTMAETNDNGRQWVQDALEDDEVREILKSRRHEGVNHFDNQ